MTRLGLLTISLLLVLAVTAHASTVLLEWDANTETDLAGYNLYQQTGGVPAPFVKVQTILKGAETATITGLDPTKAYAFAVTAYSTNGQESGYSNIVPIAPFPKSPANIRAISIVITPHIGAP